MPECDSMDTLTFLFVFFHKVDTPTFNLLKLATWS